MVPYGKQLAADRVHLLDHPTEQAVVATVRALRASGLSYRAIAAELNRRGLTNRAGGRFRHTQVVRILDDGMSGPRLDLPRIRQGLATLDALLEAHPELREPRHGPDGVVRGRSPVVERHKGKPIFVRLPDELVMALDQYAAELADERPGMKASAPMRFACCCTRA